MLCPATVHFDLRIQKLRIPLLKRRRVALQLGGTVDAEELDHHPDWSNVYDRVEVRLSTHDAGGLTGLDLELAGRIDLHAAG